MVLLSRTYLSLNSTHHSTAPVAQWWSDSLVSRARTLQIPVTHSIRGGSQTNPGIFSLTLPQVSSSDNFAIGVSVTNGMATFCVMPESNFNSWTVANLTQGGIPFSFDSCILNVQTAQTTLRFTPTSQGNWDVVAVNTSSATIIVEYTPAS